MMVVFGYQEARRCQGYTGRELRPTEIKEENGDYYLERRYPAFW